jgi:hypothetical protein
LARTNNKITIYTALIGAGAVILAAIIAAYWAHNRNLNPQPKAIEYTGRVTDTNNNKIQNAKVILEADKNVQIQMTDSEGYFRVTLSEPTKAVRLRVEKETYEPFDRTVWLDRTGVEPIQLSPRSGQPSVKPSPRANDQSNNRNSQSRKKRHDEAINALIGNRP